MLNNDASLNRQPTKTWIAEHIPHQGDMCLLDRVVAWDEQQLRCTASSHRLTSNPLRSGNRLSAVCAIEYAAQAMAVHGALLASAEYTRPRAGMLVSVRETSIHALRLDDLIADLDIEVVCIHRSAANILYRFDVQADGKPLADGRAAVILDIDRTESITS